MEYRSRNNSAFPAASACNGNCAGNSLSEALDKNDNTAQLVATQFYARCQNVTSKFKQEEHSYGLYYEQDRDWSST